MSWSPVLAEGPATTNALKWEHSWWVQTKGRKPMWQKEGEQWEKSAERSLQGLWAMARTLACQEPCRVLSRGGT